MNGRPLRTPEKDEQFLQVLADGGSVKKAARAQGAGRRTVYEWRKADEDFRERWDEAIEDGTDTLEDVATERAVTDSDTLLIFTLKARRPEKYRERTDAKISGDINVTITTYAPPMIEGTAEEVKAIAKLPVDG